jgi:hypothetical protein
MTGSDGKTSDQQTGDWKIIDGIIERGYGVASGTGTDSPYPRGTIEMQIPYFQVLGLDLTGFFPGTLNVSISPKIFQLINPEFTFRQVHWTDRHPPEDFSFSRCQLLYQDAKYDGLIYYPHPETKKQHFQNPSTIEIIAPSIPGIGYGNPIQVEYDPLEVEIST